MLSASFLILLLLAFGGLVTPVEGTPTEGIALGKFKDNLKVKRDTASRLILVNSIGVKQELTRYGRVRPDKIRVIYNLLDVEYFRPPSDAERVEARARWELIWGRAWHGRAWTSRCWRADGNCALSANKACGWSAR